MSLTQVCYLDQMRPVLKRLCKERICDPQYYLRTEYKEKREDKKREEEKKRSKETKLSHDSRCLSLSGVVLEFRVMDSKVGSIIGAVF